ncbi:MAG: hypothetical protein H6Q83_2040 [Deltaproteobacteria bacterium]|nr:hypothetical protein [Deltaproteobacteria bacterium]
MATGILLLVLTSIYFFLALLGGEWDLFERRKDLPAADQMTLYEARYNEVRKHLPSHGIIGYVSDPKEHNEDRLAWAFTQYSLSPLLVIDRSVNPKGRDYPIVIGNFHRAVPGDDRMRGLSFVRDFGNGVFLLRKAAE